jgi:4-hydroxy-tetrahydrodipicolinate reductase
MGRAITNAVQQSQQFSIVAGVSRDTQKHQNNYPVYQDINEVKIEADVVIDFSNPSNLVSITDFCLKNSVALVVATTGLDKEHFDYLKQAAQSIPVLWSGNMSLGVNLLLQLVDKAAQVLGDFCDIEIIEKHHNQKIDSPSGTANMIADRANTHLQGEYIYGRQGSTGKRKQKEIGIHAVRGGSIIGEHSVIFAWQDEIIEIKHSALSRNIFALGALRASGFLAKADKGYYTMEDVINNY